MSDSVCRHRFSATRRSAKEQTIRRREIVLCQLAVVLPFIQNLKKEPSLVLWQNDIRERYIRMNNVVQFQETVLVPWSERTATCGLNCKPSSGKLSDIRFLHKCDILSFICIKNHAGNAAVSFLVLISCQSLYSGFKGTLIPRAMSHNNISDQFGLHSLSIPLSQS